MGKSFFPYVQIIRLFLSFFSSVCTGKYICVRYQTEFPLFCWKIKGTWSLRYTPLRCSDSHGYSLVIFKRVDNMTLHNKTWEKTKLDVPLCSRLSYNFQANTDGLIFLEKCGIRWLLIRQRCNLHYHFVCDLTDTNGFAAWLKTRSEEL